MIELTINSYRYILREQANFPDGSVNVRLDNTIIRDLQPFQQLVMLSARLKCSDDIMKLLNVVDAIRQVNSTVRIQACIPYALYAQQDRKCREGEAISSKVFAKLINSCNFEHVILVDPHSDVFPALVENSRVLTVVDIFKQYLYNLPQDTLLVAPDAGARKRVEEVGLHFKLEILQGIKRRDKETGQIVEISIPGLRKKQVEGRNLLIVDDIALGAGSFLPYAKQLKEFNAKRVDLYVSHGIFNQGLCHIYYSGMDHIYTTDSYCTLESTDKITIFNV